MFENSDQDQQIRMHLGTKSYMASHAALRPYMRRPKRPQHFGDRVWSSTLQLMRHLEGHGATSILDIGCGWGLLGIHLARTSKAQVTCADLDERLAPIVAANAQLNEVEVRFIARGFADLSVEDMGQELIVGSDICYSDETAQLLQELVDRASQSKARRLIIGDAGRPDFPDLVAHCQKHHGATLELVDELEGQKPSQVMTINFS